MEEVDTMKSEEPNEHKPASVEEHPLKALSYAVYTIQFMGITLDLFMDTSVLPAWHYAITTIELVFALYLSTYQIARLWVLGPSCRTSRKHKATFLLATSLSMQLAVLGMAAYSYTANSDAVEWTFFGISLAWGVVNPMTYSAVAAASVDPDEDEKKKTRMGPGAAIWSIFTKHFTKTPSLFVVGTLFAIGQAILSTYQGAVINDLTKAVTKGNATENEIERLGFILVLVWFCANLARVIFDVVSAKMFSKLEIWLRETVFDRAVESKQQQDDSSLSLADYQARYASDINGVVGLYGTMLRGVVVNSLLICTNFIFLAIYEWRVATVTLGFLAMGVTSGPTDLAGESAADVQDDVTRGLSLLQDSANDSIEAPSDQNFGDRHRKEVLEPLENHLFRKSFFSNSVDTFNNFFSSFLTAVVVITMSWNVFNGEMDSSDFLGIFFVFKQLQKPATKLSGVVKTAVKKTANLTRVNEVVFDKPQDNDDTTRQDRTVSATKNEPSERIEETG